MTKMQLCIGTRLDDGPSTCAVRTSRRRPKIKAVLEEHASKLPNALESELVAAVASLYEDGLRPFGRLVRKRLGEIASSRGESPVDGDLGRLRRACEECCSLLVELGEGSEWSALLVGREMEFVDVYNSEDVYPEALWVCMKDYFKCIDEDGGSLPGGRYSCAQTLLSCELPALQGFSLGQVCHIVQLAMTEKKLLGYLDGTIAPYERSNSMIKDTAAERCIGSSISQQIPLASWASVRSCMVEVLDSALRKGKKQVPISTLKRLFRSRFHVELSETALGYTKLSDLLQDQVFSDICSVKLLEVGYVLLPRKESFAQHELGQLKELPMANSVENRQDASDALSAALNQIVCNTFIQTKSLPLARRRTLSLPKHFGSQFVEFDDDLTCSEEKSTDVASGSLSPTLTASPLWTPRQGETDLGGSTWNMEDLYLDSLATSHSCGLKGAVDVDHAVCHFAFPPNTWSLESQMCDATWNSAAESQRLQSSGVEPGYSTGGACDGSIVRKTFIEVSSPVFSPSMLHGRSQSMPRNFGYETVCFEDIFAAPVELPVADGWKASSSLISPTCTASPFWSPRSVDENTAPSWSPSVDMMHGFCAQEPSKCVLHLSQFL